MVFTKGVQRRDDFQLKVQNIPLFIWVKLTHYLTYNTLLFFLSMLHSPLTWFTGLTASILAFLLLFQPVMAQKHNFPTQSKLSTSPEPVQISCVNEQIKMKKIVIIVKELYLLYISSRVKLTKPVGSAAVGRSHTISCTLCLYTINMFLRYILKMVSQIFSWLFCLKCMWIYQNDSGELNNMESKK